MKRETKTVTTPSGTIVEIYTYLTAREATAIKEEMYKSMKIDLKSGTPEVTDLSGQFMVEQEKKLVEMLVVSVNGDTANPLEKLMDMRDSDYQVVLTEINLSQKGNLAPVK